MLLVAAAVGGIVVVFCGYVVYRLVRTHKIVATIFNPLQYMGSWFLSFQGHPLISGATPLESGAGFA